MIYKDQTNLRIRLTMGVDITDASVLRIKYTKPDGTESHWAATSESDATGIIYYDIQTGDISASGRWRFWAWVTFSDGRSAPGEVVVVNVNTEGTE